MYAEEFIALKASEAIKALYGAEIDPASLQIPATRKEFEGDYTLLVFPLLKFTRKGPEQSCDEIGGYLVDNCPEISSFNTVKGFLNLSLSKTFWTENLQEAATKDFSAPLPSTGKRIMVEFSSPNTNKPRHLGHVRNNLLGASVSNLLKAAGNEVTIIMGARSKSLFVMEEEMRKIAGERLILITDDGSSGRKGLVTDPLKELCERGEVDEVIAIGPPIMMKFCALTTLPFHVKTTVSLNTIMIDGTGMCGGCRISVGGKTRFVCVDGPEFDAHQVDWDQMLQRMGAYREQEAAAKEHVCKAGIFK